MDTTSHATDDGVVLPPRGHWDGALAYGTAVAVVSVLGPVLKLTGWGTVPHTPAAAASAVPLADASACSAFAPLAFFLGIFHNHWLKGSRSTSIATDAETANADGDQWVVFGACLQQHDKGIAKQSQGHIVLFHETVQAAHGYVGISPVSHLTVVFALLDHDAARFHGLINAV